MRADDNETLTRVGPGTAMGKLMRCYWIPACKSDELEIDGAPMRLLLLCEKLLAFRDTRGRIGIIDHVCAHRCASLFFGRNEENGIRCVYHGWKYDVDGNCIDMPNVPAHQQFAEKIKTKAYRVTERCGIVWVYMGDEAALPPLPGLEATLLPESDVRISPTMRECNWLQNMEGDLDASHFGFLHLGSISSDEVDHNDPHSLTVTQKAPDYFVSETEWGTMYAAHRQYSNESIYYRFAHFVFPFWSLYPDGDFENHIVAQAWVPMDDNHTMNFNFFAKVSKQLLRTNAEGEYFPGLEPDTEYLPNSSDWLGRWRRAARMENDYKIDREAQKAGNFTGIKSVPTQDMAIIASMGAAVDRTHEHLAPSDKMVARTRRRILFAARALEVENIAPPAIDNVDLSRRIRSGAFVASNKIGWMDAYHQAMSTAISPLGTLDQPPG